MTKSSLISFTCDGPECETSTFFDNNASVFQVTPDDWYLLEVPEGHFDGEDLTFCSARCLATWATNKAVLG